MSKTFEYENVKSSPGFHATILKIHKSFFSTVIPTWSDHNYTTHLQQQCFHSERLDVQDPRNNISSRLHIILRVDVLSVVGIFHLNRLLTSRGGSLSKHTHYLLMIKNAKVRKKKKVLQLLVLKWRILLAATVKVLPFSPGSKNKVVSLLRFLICCEIMPQGQRKRSASDMCTWKWTITLKKKLKRNPLFLCIKRTG